MWAKSISGVWSVNLDYYDKGGGKCMGQTNRELGGPGTPPPSSPRDPPRGPRVWPARQKTNNKAKKTEIWHQNPKPIAVARLQKQNSEYLTFTHRFQYQDPTKGKWIKWSIRVYLDRPSCPSFAFSFSDRTGNCPWNQCGLFQIEYVYTIWYSKYNIILQWLKYWEREISHQCGYPL